MHNFRRYFEQDGDEREAVRKTLTTTGQALLFTSVVLSCGFFIYMAASMRNLFYFGMLTGITILLAFLADLLLAPALMTLVARRARHKRERVAEAKAPG
jgi:predicted RND superfamily exporter protein